MHWNNAFQHLIPNMLHPPFTMKCAHTLLMATQEEDNHALEELLGFPLLKDGARLGWLMNLNSVNLLTCRKRCKWVSSLEPCMVNVCGTTMLLFLMAAGHDTGQAGGLLVLFCLGTSEN
jgi:hypothetical protein